MPEKGSNSGDSARESRQTLRIALIEDHVILRDGLRSLLNMEPDFEIVGEAENCDTGLEVVKESGPRPGHHGYRIARTLRADGYPPIERTFSIDASAGAGRRIARMNMCAPRSNPVRMATCSRDASREELIHGIRTVMDGQQYFSTQVTSHVVSGFLGNAGNVKKRKNSKITPRETEVLKLIASAYSTKEIANLLDLSVKTVEKHRSNLMRKLGLKSSAAVTLYAVRNNYLSIDLDLPDPDRSEK